mmetsp:Transcript_117075/g.227641  ORF Transcript_117075/g.227641 Transcript_117075/m.227641 type:complete len:82 (+) Transcript_117075:29-274(+)
MAPHIVQEVLASSSLACQLVNFYFPTVSGPAPGAITGREFRFENSPGMRPGLLEAPRSVKAACCESLALKREMCQLQCLRW